MNFSTITATIQLCTPLHIGAGKSVDETSDELLLRNARGEIVIPGTSLAGSLRAVATRLAPHLDDYRLCLAIDPNQQRDPNRACNCLTCLLFGTLNPQEDPKNGGHAARLRIYDAKLSSNYNLQIRDGVGIDRASGAAARAERLKYDVEIVAAGAEFQLRMELDRRLRGNAREQQALQLLAATLAEWKAGRGFIGGRSRRGLGAIQLVDVRFAQSDFANKQVLFDFLRNGQDWTAKAGDNKWLEDTVSAARQQIQEQASQRSEQANTAQTTPVVAMARTWAKLDFTLAIDGPFLTNDLVHATLSGFDHAPVLAQYGRVSAQGALGVLPGSSLRGVLRSQAERIARTIATQRAWGDEQAMNPNAPNIFSKTCPACS
ncbi:MAG: hypothetical protein KDE46_19740, partial [Caldilineaceae bacterium]|nr:hypothetical protein [Caldilineaceae bacterium]